MHWFLELIDDFNKRIGMAVGWLVLAMVLMQFAIVLLRHVFGMSFLQMQEIVVFMHGLVFMLAAALVLQIDKHVRVDIFYEQASLQKKALVNLAGSVLLLIPMMTVIWIFSFPYVLESWSIFEGSPDPGGFGFLYLQKSVILIFAAMMGLQGLAIMARSATTMRDSDQ